MKSKTPDPPSKTYLMGMLQVHKLITQARFRWVTELDLQDGIEELLKREGVDYRREANLGESGVIDFLVGDVGVEVKIKGRVPTVVSQLTRYASHESINSLILVTGRLQLSAIPNQIDGVDVSVCTLEGSLF